MPECRMKACTEPFMVTDTMKQGCMLAPVALFTMVFSALRTDAFRSRDIGVDLTIAPTANCSILRGCYLRLKTYDPTACDFLFADDCALNASSHQDMQVSKDLFAKACTDFGLAISTKKTEVLHQPSTRSFYFTQSAPHRTQHHHQRRQFDSSRQVHLSWQPNDKLSQHQH